MGETSIISNGKIGNGIRKRKSYRMVSIVGHAFELFLLLWSFGCAEVPLRFFGAGSGSSVSLSESLSSWTGLTGSDISSSESSSSVVPLSCDTWSAVGGGRALT